LRRLVRRQIDAGVHFLVPCGTTGESPTLSREEHLRVVEIVVEEAQGRVPVVAGAGGYNTREVIELSRAVERLGVDGLLSVTPYYNKPTQEGLFQHYRAIAESTPLPIVVYNVPGRTGTNVEPATLARLAELPNIVAVKEASANLAQVASIAQLAPERFIILSGDDALTIPICALGGRGVISVVSNVMPAEMSALAAHCRVDNFAAARDLQRQLLPIMEASFYESNPIPVKWMLSRMGLIAPVWRLPLVEPRPATRERIEAVLRQARLAEAA
jgi:4-hydroxy-tetrahydrodipicolinate synthase